MLRELQIPKSVRDTYDTGTVASRITGLSKLNVFIGPNNCGKSRLLRELFADDNLVFSLATEEGDQVTRLVQRLLAYLSQADLPTVARERANELFNASFPPLQNETGQVEKVKNEADLRVLQRLDSPNQLFDTQSDEGKDAIGDARNLFHQMRATRKDRLTPIQFKRLYIPSLRGLRRPENEADFYFQRTVKDYFGGARRLKEGNRSLTTAPILTGLELYEEVESHLLGTLEQRETIAEYQEFLGDAFFDGTPVTLIPRKGHDVLHIKIGDETEQPAYNLGDGIQQLIIMTLPLFVHRESNLLLFIEEPELYLHPGFQRRLIDIILDDQYRQTQVFVATHSHHFLDITIDRSSCSIYKLNKQLEEGEAKEKTAKFHIERSCAEDFALLAELGVRNSSVLLANCTIWVEGITDRLYFQTYLDLYQRGKDEPFMEDLHYCFIEYGGANIAHWSFSDEGVHSLRANRLCGRAFVVADSDRGKEKRHERLTDTLGDRYYRLRCREIENLLTPEVVAKVVKSYEGGDAKLNEFTYEAYRDKYLGRFVENRVFEDLTTSKRRSSTGHPYMESSGTIKDKLGFCRRAIENIKELEDMSEEAIELSRRIYEFIRSQNAR